MGGSPESVIRAARYGLPLMLAIIGGPLINLYDRTLKEVVPLVREQLSRV
jgi:hypothetical protein